MAKPRAKVAALPKSVRRKVGDLEYNPELFERLRTVRKTLADAAGVPPFVIFSDVALAEMAAYRPIDDEGFLRIHGVGAHKLERYGAEFLGEIRRFCKTATGEN
jgi:ATP-dependent DNA helicase RecQ